MRKGKERVLAKAMLIGAGASVGSGSGAFSFEAGPEPPPNVLFVWADDMGWGDLSCNGGQTPTPNIDRLFERGVRLNQFLVNPVSSPSRAAFLTGFAPEIIHQAPSVDGVLDPAIRTVAHSFREAGYATGAFGKWHNSLAPKFAPRQNESIHHVNDYGFDRFVGFYGGGIDYFTKIWARHTDSPVWYHDRVAVDNEPGYVGDLLTEHAISFMEQNLDQPFFCYVPQLLVHTPLHLSGDVLDRIPEELVDAAGGLKTEEEYYLLGCKALGRNGERMLEAYNRINGTSHQWDDIPEPTDAEIAVLYSGLIISKDDQVGRLLEFLDEHRLRENTLVIFSSDNGATPVGSNLPFRGGKHSLWEGGIRVPTAIYWPRGGLAAEIYRSEHGVAEYNELLRIFDLYPTFATWAGLPGGTVPENISGRDFSTSLENHVPVPGRGGFYYMWRTYDVWRTSRWKLFRYADPSRNELFDLTNDPYETSNVIKENRGVVQSLKQERDDYLQTYAVRPSMAPVPDAAGALAEPDGEVLSIRYDGPAPGRAEQLFQFGSIPPRSDETRLKTSDVLSYDIRVRPGSATSGFHIGFTRWGTAHYYRNGVAPDGRVFSDYCFEHAVGEWQRVRVGMGNFAPAQASRPELILHPDLQGGIDIQIDNVCIERADGTRIVLWDSGGAHASASEADVQVELYLDEEEQGRLVQHLTAPDGVMADGTGVVKGWIDQSGEGNDAVPGSGSVLYPAGQPFDTGLAGLDFGTDRNTLVLWSPEAQEEWLDFSGAASGNNGFCVMIAFRCDAPLDDWSEMIGNATFLSDNGFVIRFARTDGGAGRLQALLNGTTIQKTPPLQAVAPGDAVVVGFNYYAPSGTMSFWDSLNHLTHSATVPATDFSMGEPVTLGSSRGSGRYLRGVVGEVRVYDGVLGSDRFMQELEAMVSRWIPEDSRF